MDRILISRTDSIGDVILTLPLAGLLKELYPNSEILFLGRKYTVPILEHSENISQNFDWDKTELINFPEADAIIHVFPRKEIAIVAKEKAIPLRIGTSHRLYHWLYCNSRPSFSRKNSDLHEAQLNLKLAEPLGLKGDYSLETLSNYYGWVNDKRHFETLDSTKFNLIMHCKSKGSAKEWDLKNYVGLIRALPSDQFRIFITGTQEEGKLIKEQAPTLFEFDHVEDTTGKFDLETLIDFIGNSDGLLAASTGPLHIAAASGIFALGLYPFDRPMHAGRWGPIGKHASFISEKSSNQEKELDIPVDEVKKQILEWAN